MNTLNTILLMGAKSKTTPLEAVPEELSKLKTIFTQANLKDFQIQYEPYLTIENLSDLLRQSIDKLDLIHYAGHSSPDGLLLNDDLVYMSHIAKMLKTATKKPRLIFLNGCENKAQVTNLLDAGVGLVIATHKAINDQLAVTFAHEFYKNLFNTQTFTSYQQAFERASALACLNRADQARSLDLDSLELKSETAGDWGLFTNDPNKANDYFISVASTNTTTNNSNPRCQQLLKREQLLQEKLSILEDAYDRETRVEEKFRVKPILDEAQHNLAEVQRQITLVCG